MISIFILSIIATYFVNLPIFYSLRPVDLLFIVMAICGIGRLKFKINSLLSVSIAVFWLSFFASILYGIITIGIITPENLIFIYKYSIPFILITLILKSKLDERQIKFLLKLLLCSFMVIVFYEFVMIYLYESISPVLARKYRPSFPYTESFRGDPHLLAAYLSTGLLAIVFSYKYRIFASFRMADVFFPILIVVSIIAVVMTGSRNGVVTAGLTIFAWTVITIWVRLKQRGLRAYLNRKTICCVVFCIIAVTVLAFVIYQSSSSAISGSRFARTFYFNFLNEQSSLGRLAKFEKAYNIAKDSFFVIGVGMQSCSHRFFDGGIGALLVSSGLLGLAAFFTIIAAFLKKLYQKAKQNNRLSEHQVIFWVFFNYCLACSITEFFLVSRSIMPFAVFIGLMGRLINISKPTDVQFGSFEC